MANYISLYSSSEGNCSVIEENGKFILIDMGKSAGFTNKAIQSLGLDVKNLQGILISHEHTDHIQGLKVFLKKINVPVYSNTLTLKAMEQAQIFASHTKIYDGIENGCMVGDFFISGFDTPHDSAGCMGFTVQTLTGGKMTLATDLGQVTPEIQDKFKGCTLAVLESNYDLGMLRQNDRYPVYLKNRIASDRGHLSNTQFSKAAVEMVKNGVEKIHLCHLSSNNNTPNTALSAFALEAMNSQIDIQKDIHILKANKKSEITPPTQF